MAPSQKHAVQNYRTRLHERGLARFEVLGRDADRDLIRSLARRLAEGKARGQPRSALDMMAAVAVAEANGCTVVTGNGKDFAGIEVINLLRNTPR